MGLLLAHATATLAMTGLAWFVQVVHYPLFAHVPIGELAAYERVHVSRTTWVVAPLMLVEAASAVLIAIDPPAGVGRELALAGLALAGLVWASTVLVQVPSHRRLEADPRPEEIARLVRWSWPRTLLWTARSGIALAMIAAA